MGAIAAYGIVGLFISALRQDLSHPWRYSSATAQSTLHRWIAFGAMGIVLDIAALLAPVYLTWGVRVDRSEKMRVTMAFASRAPVIIFTVLRLIAIPKANMESFTWSYITPEVYTQLEMHYSLVAATIPCLQIFLKVWNTSFLSMGLENIDERAYLERRSTSQYSQSTNKVAAVIYLHPEHCANSRLSTDRYDSQRNIRHGLL